MEADEIIRRYDEQYHQRRSSFDQVADLIERFIAPIRGGKFFQQQSTEQEVEFRRPEVFDSTAMESSGILSASIQGAITPADTQWFDLTFRDEELRDDSKAKAWIQECAEITYLALEDSSFELANQEAVQDLVDFGNTAVFEEELMENELFAGLAFDCIPIRELYFDEDHDTSVLTLYRRLQWTPLQIVSKFKSVPETVKARALDPNSSQVRMDVIFCIYPRDDVEGDQAFPTAPKNRPYGSKYILKEGREQLGDEGGYYEMPVYLTRWQRTSGSKYGHGPGHLALPTVFTLNTMVEQELTYVEKIIDPTTLVNEKNFFGSLDFTAGSINVLQDITESGVRPFESGARYGDAKMSQEDLRQMVRSIYKVDQLQMKESPQMTAFEASVRANEILRLFGPTRGRMQRELYAQAIQRSFNILMRNDQLPAPPESVVEYANGKVGTEILDIVYQGPMARAQKQEDVDALLSAVTAVAQLAEAGFPRALDKIDEDVVVDELVELTGAPAKIIRDSKQLKRLRDAREAREAELMQAQTNQEIGKGEQELAEGQRQLEAVA